MTSVSTRSGLGRLQSPLWGIGASVGFVAIILAVLMYFDVHEKLVPALEWVDRQGVWSGAWFIAIMAAVVILLLPGIFFTTGAGFVFGVVEGTLYVVVGTTIGAGAAFLIARYLFGERASRFVRDHSRLQAVDEEMARHDFQIVLLTRLIPFFPGKLSNYFFGLTGFSFPRYLGASLIGFIPFSLHNVYLGSLAGDLVSLGEREFARTPLQWTLYLSGFFVAVFAIVYCNRLARRALARYTTEDAGAER